MHLILLALLYGVAFTLTRCGHSDVVRVDRFSRAGRSVAAAGAGRGSAEGRIAQTVYRAEQSVEQAAERFRKVERNIYIQRNCRYIYGYAGNRNAIAEVDYRFDNTSKRVGLKNDSSLTHLDAYLSRAYVNVYHQHVLHSAGAHGILLRRVGSGYCYHYVAGVGRE